MTKSPPRALLWGVLVLSAAANAITSALGVNLVLSTVFGVVTLASGIALVANYHTHR
ncbi:hypothetical protein [Amycolatopsis sp. Poz14]|uniref:hypothetical protein n=1 Tax=Amycolatopsis sp. Poz14 TaxID=1447705 RepID=UPI001EE7DF4E|nr:hypothetical protein [Amycolatopsis sp. Poz14]MCG3757230.1 hypothetical protein [Amycolatopsis sp. Poz14]